MDTGVYHHLNIIIRYNIYTYMHAHTHKTHTCIRTHANVHVHAHTHTHVYIHKYIRTYDILSITIQWFMFPLKHQHNHTMIWSLLTWVRHHGLPFHMIYTILLSILFDCLCNISEGDVPLILAFMVSRYSLSKRCVTQW